MSWRYPPYNLEDNQVVDVDDANDIFYAYAEEVNGSLNEHNVVEASLAATDFPANSVCKLHRSVQASDGSDRTVTGVNEFQFRDTGSWETVDDMTVEFTGRGTLWIMASMQVNNTGGGTGCRVGVRLNGELITGSIIGPVDTDQDEPDPDLGGGVPGILTTSYVIRAYMPLCSEAIVQVPEGRHRVELVGQVIGGASAYKTRVYNRELIVLEFRK